MKQKTKAKKSREWEATYHFYHLESGTILHGHNAGNSEVRSVVRKLCRKRLVEIVVYLNRDPLSSQKEQSHVLYWSLSFGEGRNLPQKLKYLISAGDVGWLWTGRKRSHVLKGLIGS